MSAWTVIQHIEVPSAQANIEFTSIPSTYTDLLLVGSIRFARSAVDTTIRFEFSGNSSSYTHKLLYGDGANTASQAPAYAGWQNANTSTSSTFGNFQIYMPNYASSNFKSFSVDMVMENNATASFQNITAGLWSNTSPISSIKMFDEALGSNVMQYSSATLWGITKGSSGGVTVS
jgi:hypothetical protein